jgi:hypothetical protein
MAFIRNLLRNTIVLAILGLAAYYLVPGLLAQIIHFYWWFAGPVILLLVVAFAFPGGKEK